MTSSFNVRRATPADAPRIVQLLRRVFSETYGHVIPTDALHHYLDTAFSEPVIAEGIVQIRSNCLLVFREDDLAGMSELAMQPTPECVQASDAVEIARFYIDASFRGRGAANALLASCEQHVRDLGRRAMWLCVWEHNARAIAFYAKRGFAHVGAMDIVVEGVIFHDAVMLKKW